MFQKARDGLSLQLENPEETSEASLRMEDYFKKNKDIHKELSATGQLVWTEKQFLELSDDIKLIWSDKGIKETFNYRSRMMTENFVSTVFVISIFILSCTLLLKQPSHK